MCPRCYHGWHVSISVHFFKSIPEAAIKRLLILGSGPFAQEVADVAACGDEYTLAGFVENWDRGRCGERLNGLPILWVDDLGGVCARSLGHLLARHD